MEQEIREGCARQHKRTGSVFPPSVCPFCMGCAIGAVVVGIAGGAQCEGPQPIPEADRAEVRAWLATIPQPKKPTPQVPAPWSPHGNPEHPRRQALATFAEMLAESRRRRNIPTPAPIVEVRAVGGRTHGAEWLMRPAADAFRDAIEAGRLSDRDAQRPPYAAHAPYAQDFMYMGTFAGVDAFKNSQTRQYLPAQEATQ